MPKKKGKKNDDWEEDADAIVEANKQEEKKLILSAKLDALFAEAISRGHRTDAEYDRATDDLAGGVKTEDELIAFYFPNQAQEEAIVETDASAEKDKKLRAWRAARDGRNAKDLVDVSDAPEDPVAAAKAAAEAEEQLKQLHVEFFGAPDAPHAIQVDADGLQDIERVVQSELQFDEWRRAACDVPKELPLPNMTGVALFGTYGASTHAGGLLRLWDGASGRRLAASQQKAELSAIAA